MPKYRQTGCLWTLSDAVRSLANNMTNLLLEPVVKQAIKSNMTPPTGSAYSIGNPTLV